MTILRTRSLGVDFAQVSEDSIRYAVEKGNTADGIRIVEILLEKDVNIHIKQDQALQIAARLGFLPVVEMLMKVER